MEDGPHSAEPPDSVLSSPPSSSSYHTHHHHLPPPLPPPLTPFSLPSYSLSPTPAPTTPSHHHTPHTPPPPPPPDRVQQPRLVTLFNVLSQDRVPKRLLVEEQRLLVGVFKALSQDRVQQLVVELFLPLVFKIFPQSQVKQLVVEQFLRWRRRRTWSSAIQRNGQRPLLQVAGRTSGIAVRGGSAGPSTLAPPWVGRRRRGGGSRRSRGGDG